MTAKNLTIRSISRTGHDGEIETLEFVEGANVIVGMPNTGKTQWLRMLDFVLGDSDKPGEAFDDDLAEKYCSLVGHISVGGTLSKIERHWDKPDSRSRVAFDESEMSAEDFSSELLSRLGIPEVRYPQGNPLGTRTWPTLGWRSLLRHIYRRQSSWNDIAHHQPESEQHAVLMQFLGAAQQIFSEDASELASRQRELARLQAAKDQFYTALNLVSQALGNDSDQVAVTTETLDTAQRELSQQAKDLQSQREDLLRAVRSAGSLPERPELIEGLTKRAAELAEELAGLEKQRAESRARLAEIESYQAELSSEEQRLERARLSGTVLTRLRVTHCPACDRPVSPEEPNSCYVCHRPEEFKTGADSRRRIELEARQLEAEHAEASDLVASAQTALNALEREIVRIKEALRLVRARLTPMSSRAAAILPPELGEFDFQYGRVQEKLGQIERTRAALRHRDVLAKQIDDLQAKILELDKAVRDAKTATEFEHLGDVLADGMNSYLGTLRRENASLWTQAAVTALLRERDFTLLVGNRRWSKKLGGTLTLYFLLAYNYALLTLSNRPRFNYPGLCILDLPPKLEDGSTTADKENFVLEPFLRLLRTAEMRGTQLIATGSAFQNLSAHRIELDRVWK